MKWLRRAPWREAFSEVLDSHLGPACAKSGIEISELAEVVGAHWAATLWGCAFEDFLARDLEHFPIIRGHSRQQRNSFRIPLV